MKKRTKFWSFRNEATTGTGKLYLYGPIDSESWWGDEVTPTQFQEDLDSLGDISQLDVYINSDGGDVFAGQAIHSMLKRHPANVTVHVDGLAASIASVIAMAGNHVLMPRNSMMMVHNPWTFMMGNSDDLRKRADDLDQIRESLIAAYQDKSGIDRDQLVGLLNAETWMTAEEAVSYGFADEIEESKQVAASIRGDRLVVNGQEMDLSPYRHPPNVLVAAAQRDPDEAEPGGPDAEEDHEPLFTIGSDIKLKVPPRVPGQSTGDVREVVLSYAYGIRFDGMEDDGIYHWYLESELEPGQDPPSEAGARRTSAASAGIQAGVCPKDISDKLAPRDAVWSKPALKDFTDKSWADLTDQEKKDIAGHFAWAKENPAAKFDDLKLPHHRPSDGAVVWKGLTGCAGRLNQTDIPEEDMPKVKEHLGHHYKEFGETPPWEQDDNNSAQLALFERRLRNNQHRTHP